MKANTKNKKGNSTMKKLIPAAGMLMISASMLATSTFAWFTMNREVQVTNMQVQAKAEGGLLISETSGHATTDQWDDIATANSLPTGVVLLPTSSSNTVAWYHANSKSANDEAGADTNTLSSNLSGSYSTLSLTNADTAAVAGTSAKNSIYYTNDDGTAGYTAAGDSAYYVKYTYFLKTSNETGVTGLALTDGAQSLSIKDVTVTNTDNVSTALNKSLRVGVAIGGKFYIFAPIYTGESGDAPADYYVYNGSSATGNNIQISAIPANGVAYTDVASLNGITTDSPLQADIYMWYEGEDPNCKSENITATLDTLKVGLKFELATNSGAKSLPTNNAKSTSSS